jgi:hypothetical protein
MFSCAGAGSIVPPGASLRFGHDTNTHLPGDQGIWSTQLWFNSVAEGQDLAPFAGNG